MNIDEMEAGRELDALIAEKVMGLDWIYNVEWMHQQGRYIGKFRVEFYPVVVASGEYAGTYLERYSTDITAAWQVVEKLEQSGKDWGVCKVPQRNIYKVAFRWNIGSPDTTWGWEGNAEGYANTVRLAICRAALKAVMEALASSLFATQSMP